MYNDKLLEFILKNYVYIFLQISNILQFSLRDFNAKNHVVKYALQTDFADFRNLDINTLYNCLI